MKNNQNLTFIWVKYSNISSENFLDNNSVVQPKIAFNGVFNS